MNSVSGAVNPVEVTAADGFTVVGENPVNLDAPRSSVSLRKPKKSMKNSVFWIIMVCNLLKVIRCLRATCLLHLQGQRIRQAKK